MGSQRDAQKMHIKDFEKEFDDKIEKYFRNMSTIVAVKFSTVHNYALLCDRNIA